jgi:hypothetical protein
VTSGAQEATGTPQLERPGAGNLEEAVDQPVRPIDSTRFAHASEAEMARILDFYQVAWEYEPTTFPILWNLEGDVVESFAPDFYLPDLEVFLEMTTLKQRLVRKKNRKLRRLRELYPDIRIKLFYARDFRAMMLKYGRLGLAESLSGTLGQVMPQRAPVEIAPLPVALEDTTIDVRAADARALDVPVPTVDLGALDLPSVEPAPSLSVPSAEAVRANPRARSGRRRRRAATTDQAGAERKAQA